MSYDFQTYVNRTEQGSKKWRLMYEQKDEVAEGVVPLSVADLDFKMAPGIIEGLKQDLDDFILGYTLPTDKYYNSVIKWMKERHQWDVEADWIVTAPGVVPAINVFVNAFTKIGDKVLILEPVYYPFAQTIQNQGRTVVAVSLVNEEGSYRIDYQGMEEAIVENGVKAMLFCNPHNPLGRVWAKEELEKVAEICQKHGVLIFSDEIHFDLVHPGHKHHVFATISEQVAQNVIVGTAPSKTFNLAGLMTSNIIIPNPELREIYTLEADRLNLLTVPALGILACQHAYETSGDWNLAFVDLVVENVKRVEAIVREMLPQAIITPISASYLMWIDLRAYGLTCKEVEACNVANDVFIDEGYIFGNCGKCFVRIHVGAPTEVVETTVKRMCQGILEASAKKKAENK